MIRYGSIRDGSIIEGDTASLGICSLLLSSSSDVTQVSHKVLFCSPSAPDWLLGGVANALNSPSQVSPDKSKALPILKSKSSYIS